MGCINPPHNVTEPTLRRSGRLAFTLDSAAVNGAKSANVGGAAEFAAAKQSGRRAAHEIKSSSSATEVDVALAKGKSALELALVKVHTSAQRQSLQARIGDLEKKAADRKSSIQASGTGSWEPAGSKNPNVGQIMADDGTLYTVSWKSGRQGTSKAGHTLIADGDFSSEGKTAEEAREAKRQFDIQANHNHYGPDFKNPGEYFDEDRGAYTGPDH